MRSWPVIAALCLAACAAGVDAGSDDDQVSVPDASHVSIDAPHGSIDAPPPPSIDAARPDASIPDAVPPPDGQVFCNSTADCSPGKCCSILGQPPGLCITGTDINGFCLPG
jgi:hypothetical protein